jgi:hypothetical protein
MTVDDVASATWAGYSEACSATLDLQYCSVASNGTDDKGMVGGSAAVSDMISLCIISNSLTADNVISDSLAGIGIVGVTEVVLTWLVVE